MFPAEYELCLMRKTTPSLRYSKSEDFLTWQKNARAKLRELLGLDKMGFCEPLVHDFKKTGELAFEEYTFSVETEPGFLVPCHFCLPQNARAKNPLVICLQGHTTGAHISLGRAVYPGDKGYIEGGDRDFALQVLREGYCALVIEMRGFGALGGTPKGPACHIPAMAALLLGRTMLGERVWDVSRVLDAVLNRFDCIDPSDIYCMGNSGGGTVTYYAACMDERITLAMPSCSVCAYRDSIATIRHCVCNFIPKIAEYFDMGDLAGLIAPRKLVVVHGINDEIFPKEGVFEAYETIKKMYEAAGAPDNCRLVTGPAGHRFYADAAWATVKEMISGG